ncbi:MAG: HAMP domain-containing histidine kinase [Spirochaetaceae bacterium]|jgi:signal transduction histidine kinase|nr:HAMP domain-containing histidine kinase [Spirochaetaceae bacterium]
MKIKTQFYLLIAGLILLPILTIAAQAIFRRLDAERQPQPTVPIYEDIEQFGGEGMSRKDWREISRFIRQRREGTDIAVFSDDLRVIYSTIPEFGAGEPVGREQIFNLLKLKNARYGWNFETPPWLADGKIFILSKIDRTPPPPPVSTMRERTWQDTARQGTAQGNVMRPLAGEMEPPAMQGRLVVVDRSRRPNPTLLFTHWLLLVVALVIGFALVMSFVIARSITQSVLVIEEVTRRIAAGELDTNVNVSTSKLFRSGNEITSLAASLNRMRLALKEEERRRTRFIMGITHDLKTPLALIKGYTEAITDGMTSDPAALKQSLAIIADKSDQLETMINDLLSFIKIDSGEWLRLLVPVNLTAFLGDYAERIKSDAELLRHIFESDIRLPPDTHVPMDTALVVRALENLIGNALRYTPEGGLVRLSAWLESGEPAGPPSRIVIEVRDNGPGIGADDLPHVFETFYRGTSSRREQGMGLGLSVVKGIVETHGWTISVHSPEDGSSGAAFRIGVPVPS